MQYGTLKMLLAQQIRVESDLEVCGGRGGTNHPWMCECVYGVLDHQDAAGAAGPGGVGPGGGDLGEGWAYEQQG